MNVSYCFILFLKIVNNIEKEINLNKLSNYTNKDRQTICLCLFFIEFYKCLKNINNNFYIN